MIPMKLDPEVYAKHMPPAPDYLLVQRLPMKYEKIGSLHLPQGVKDIQLRFITIGKILAISDLTSEDPQVEYMKEQLRKIGYVTFAAHITAECCLFPQFYFDKDIDLVMIHVKDAVQLPQDVDGLLRLHADFEAEQIRREEAAVGSIEEERAKLLEMSSSGNSRAGVFALIDDGDNHG